MTDQRFMTKRINLLTRALRAVARAVSGPVRKALALPIWVVVFVLAGAGIGLTKIAQAIEGIETKLA